MQSDIKEKIDKTACNISGAFSNILYERSKDVIGSTKTVALITSRNFPILFKLIIFKISLKRYNLLILEIES